MAGKLTNRKQAAVKKNGNGGVKQLNKAALAVVEREAKPIADALMEATRKGHVMSTRLLIELAERCLDAEETKAMRPFRKLLEDLAAEAQLPAETLGAAEAEAL